MKPFLKVSFLFISLLVFLGCSPKEVTAPENEFLQAAELLNNIEASDFKSQLADSFGSASDLVAFYVQYDIEQYRITYTTTDVDGSTILASGAVILPKNITTPLAMGSIQHGTLFNEQDAPSYFKFQTEGTLGSLLASTGIIMGMPDYIGYGVSKDRAHPYEHNKGLAVANVDFIRAMKEFVAEKELDWNGNLMLAGYSEGGYATMATHKLLEETYANEFNVLISVCGAGAYNKTATLQKLINEAGSSEVANNSSYIWVLRTYDQAYNLNKPMSYYFKEPYASAIETNGHLVEITVSLHETLTAEFVNDFNSGALSELEAALADNDVYDWRPNAIVRLYHGDADQYVPLLNSETAFNAMKNKGVDVELNIKEGGTHGSTIGDYFFGVFQEFIVHKGDAVL